jgi:hypothetical protein
LGTSQLLVVVQLPDNRSISLLLFLSSVVAMALLLLLLSQLLGFSTASRGLLSLLLSLLTLPAWSNLLDG